MTTLSLRPERKPTSGSHAVINVWRLSVEETCVTDPTEVQGNRETDLPRCLDIDRSRLTNRYNRPAATVVALTDDHPNWRPARYEHAL